MQRKLTPADVELAGVAMLAVLMAADVPNNKLVAAGLRLASRMTGPDGADICTNDEARRLEAEFIFNEMDLNN